MIELFSSDPRDRETEALRARVVPWLDSAELARFARYRHAPTAHVYLATRELARTVLARVVGEAPGELVFERDALERPRLAAHPEIHFSLANGPSLVVCTVARCAHGVDAEALERGAALLGMQDLVFSDDERAHLASSSDPARDAVRLWTLKEAYLKARGVGLRVDPRAASFALGQAGADLRVSTPLSDDTARWEHTSLGWETHLVAVSAERGAGPVVRRDP